MCDQLRPESGLLGAISAPDSKCEAARIQHAVFTRAGCDLAWKVFSDVRLWPAFAERFDAQLHWGGTPWSPGSRLVMASGGQQAAIIECMITLFAPPQCAAWINRVGEYSMQQCVLFEPYFNGGTRISTWIELTDPALRGGSVKLRSMLKSLLHTWFSNFTAECDHLARTGSSDFCAGNSTE